MTRLGVTGGIGSGKSLVCSELRRLGVPVYDCDTEAKRLCRESAALRRALVELAGPEVCDGRGVDRAALARYLFSSPERAAAVAAVVHPEVRRDFLRWAAGRDAPLVAVESAILYESGMDTLVDDVLFVDAPRETRLRRAMRRDGAEAALIEARMDRQDPAEARRRAGHVLLNDGDSPERLRRDTRAALRSIMEQHHIKPQTTHSNMLKDILAISGKPGLYRLVSRGNRNLIVETLDAQKRRMPVFGADKVIALADIAMYTDEEEVPLRRVLKAILDKENGAKLALDARKASPAELSAFLEQVLPNYDRDRVYPTDMRKLAQWYNILVENGVTDFDEPEETAAPEA